MTATSDELEKLIQRKRFVMGKIDSLQSIGRGDLVMKYLGQLTEVKERIAVLEGKTK